MKPRELPIYLLLPEHHPGLPATDLLDLVASRFPADAWRARIAEQGALAVAFEHARWLLANDPAPLAVPVSAFTTRIFSFAHGVLSFTVDDLLRWFVDHGCVDASEVETLPADPPPTPSVWTPNATPRVAPAVAEPQKHWLFDAEDPYAVLEAMGDTPDRPVLTVGHDDSEEPYPYVVVPVRYALDVRADVERQLAELRAEEAEAADADADDDPEDDDDDRPGTVDAFERFYGALPPLPREQHADWLPTWLREHLERRVPTLVTGEWCVGDEDEDETPRTMAAALREVGFVVTDENLVPSVASWVDDYECGSI